MPKGIGATLTIPSHYDVAQLYQKIAGNWDAIDKLGPNLLACKTLYELSVMNELRDLARDIIGDCIKAVNNEGRQSIDAVMTSISYKKCDELDTVHLTNQFHVTLQAIHEKIIQKAFSDYRSKTERSCYPPEIKQKVEKLIKPPILNMQGLLREQFDDCLYKAHRDARVSSAQHHLIETVQQEFERNINLGPAQLQARIAKVCAKELETCKQTLRSQSDTPDQTTAKILEFYNSDLNTKIANATAGSIYNLLHPLDVHQFQKTCQKLQDIYHCVMRCTEQQKQCDNSWKNRLKTFLGTNTRNDDLEFMWNNIYLTVERWFHDKHFDKENKDLLLKIVEILLPQLRKDMINLVNNQFSSSSSDPRMIPFVFTFIENLCHQQIIRDHMNALESYEFLHDIAVFALRILIEEMTKVEQSRHEKEVKKAIDDMNTWKESVTTQVRHMQDSFEQGKNMAKIVSKQIFEEIGRVLLDKILRDVAEDIAKSHFINHDAVQNQAYGESFGQGNGEKILKYVLDINRYFVELSLREISARLEAIIHMHIQDAEQIIMTVFNVANDIAQRSKCDNVRQIADEIEKGICGAVQSAMKVNSRFALTEVMSVPIKTAGNFKQGFKTLLTYIGIIHDYTANLTRKVKMDAYAGCKHGSLDALDVKVVALVAAQSVAYKNHTMKN